MPPHRPLVGVPACVKQIGPHPYHCVGQKYLEAMTAGAGVLPLALPSLGPDFAADDLLPRLDGVLLTGSYSMIDPARYGDPPSPSGTLLDPDRDATVFSLIHRIIDAGIPLLAICRGFQELNVAFGGTLHQAVHEVPGMLDHREDPSQPLEVQYGPAHLVALSAGGELRALWDADTMDVNSIHEQGVNALAPGLVVEATAPDGLIEGFRVDAASAFAVGVQWHPEWQFRNNPFSVRLFERFGEAVRQYADARARGATAGA